MRVVVYLDEPTSLTLSSKEPFTMHFDPNTNKISFSNINCDFKMETNENIEEDNYNTETLKKSSRVLEKMNPFNLDPEFFLKTFKFESTMDLILDQIIMFGFHQNWEISSYVLFKIQQKYPQHHTDIRDLIQNEFLVKMQKLNALEKTKEVENEYLKYAEFLSSLFQNSVLNSKEVSTLLSSLCKASVDLEFIDVKMLVLILQSREFINQLHQSQIRAIKMTLETLMEDSRCKKDLKEQIQTIVYSSGFISLPAVV